MATEQAELDWNPSPNGVGVGLADGVGLNPERALGDDLRSRVKQLRLDTQLGGAKGRALGGAATYLPWALCAALAFAWAGVAGRSYRAVPGDAAGNLASGSPSPAAGAAGSAGQSTPTAPPAEPGTIQLEVKGYLVPAVQVAVSPIDAAGQLIELNIKEGAFYNQGEQLARIDPTNYEFLVSESEEGIKAAREKLKAAIQKRDEMMPQSVRQVEKDLLSAQVNEARAQKARADDELARIERLGGGVITQRELDVSRNESIAARYRLEKLQLDLRILEEGPRTQKIAAADADVATAEAEIKSAEARLAQAKWRLANCVIRAPITGTILSKKSEKGNLVNPLAFSSTTGGASGSVCDMADLSDLEADLEIPERDISKLKVGQVCKVKADAYPDRVYAAVLDRIMPIANRSKSIVNVRVKVKLPQDEAPGTYLKPEMGAVVSFLAGTASKGTPDAPAAKQ